MNDFFGLVIPDQAFWVICALFYLGDNLRPTQGRSLFLVENGRGEWIPSFPFQEFRVLGRPLTVIAPFSPWNPALKMHWLNGDAEPQAGHGDGRALAAASLKRLLKYRILAGIAVLLYFGLGPALTHYYSLGFALVMMFPVHLTLVLLVLLFLLIDRKVWQLKWHHAVGQALECFVCPGFLVNVCRKVSLKYARVPGDAISFALAGARDATREKILRRFRAYLEDLSDGGELDETPDDVLHRYGVARA